MRLGFWLVRQAGAGIDFFGYVVAEPIVDLGDVLTVSTF